MKKSKKVKSNQMKYRTDPDYRQKIIDRAKEYYAKNKKRYLEDPRKSLDSKLITVGTERINVATKKTLLCFTAEEFGSLVGWSASNVYRKWNEGLLPEPKLEAYNKGETKKVQYKRVYNKKQTKALVNILGEHFVTEGYLRPKHTKTRTKLFSVLD